MSASPAATADVATYFEGLYSSLAASDAFERAGRAVYGAAFCWLLGYATAGDLARLAELCGARAGSAILDLCCGLGGAARYFEDHYVVSAVGVDCAGAARAQAALRRGRLVQGDAGRLPFAQSSFDGLVSIDGFSYQSGSLMREAARVLKPGGGFAFLLSLRPADVGGLVDELRAASMTWVAFETATAAALDTLIRLERAYRREEGSLKAELGDRYLGAVLEEISALRDGMQRGSIERVFLFGSR